jgi:hypothetical protein
LIHLEEPWLQYKFISTLLRVHLMPCIGFWITPDIGSSWESTVDHEIPGNTSAPSRIGLTRNIWICDRDIRLRIQWKETENEGKGNGEFTFIAPCREDTSEYY